MPFKRDDAHAESTHSRGHRAADIAVTYDANGVTLDRQDIEGFPDAGHLIADHAPKVFGEIQDGRQGKFSERRAEHSGAISEGHLAIDEFGEENFLEARR